jgi:hypothetical protein
MGVVESCTSREKEPSGKVIKFGLHDFENNPLEDTPDVYSIIRSFSN